MEKRISVDEYLGMPETNRPESLEYGVVREPPAPFYGHQAVVTGMTALLSEFVRRTKLGVIVVSPIDVVLDRERALVVQPDILFIAADRTHIIDKQVWGAPDLVVEVLSPKTAAWDRERKVEWYRRYGVRECWLVDDRTGEVAVLSFVGPGEPRRRTYGRSDRLYSRVLRGFRPSIARLLAPPWA